MKELLFFELKNCPYCIRANQYLNELMEDPKYQSISIRKIDEAKEGLKDNDTVISGAAVYHYRIK